MEGDVSIVLFLVLSNKNTHSEPTLLLDPLFFTQLAAYIVTCDLIPRELGFGSVRSV